MVLRRRKCPSTLIASRANGHTVRVRWPPVGSAGRWREASPIGGLQLFRTHCLSRYVPVRSPKSRKRRRLSQQLAWWCAASSVVSQSARVVGGLLSRLCRLRPLCRPPLARACHQSPKPAVYCQTGGARAWPVVGSLSAALMVRAIARSSRARTPPSTVAMSCAVTMFAIGCPQRPG